MLGDCGFFRFFRRGTIGRVGSSYPDPELDPVLLVPGIGGSILNARNKKNGFQLRAWIRIFLANVDFKKYLWSIYNPKTGYTEPLDPAVEVLVPEDDYGLYAIDILDPSWWTKWLHFTEVYQFHDIINMLIGHGYKKGTTLFGYGYDFRQSNRIDKAMDGLKVKLATAYKASGGKKVNVISHSMGGLLMLCFLSLQYDVFQKYVNKWICIACPFQGAPGCINDALLTGLQFVYGFESYFFVSRWTMHQLLIECPSIYEMMSNPDYKWIRQPLIQVWRKESKESKASLVKLEEYGPTDSVKLFEAALRDNELNHNGKSIPLPFNLSILKWAARTRQILNDAQLPKAVSFYNIYGTSYETPFNVCYGSETSPIDDLSEICHTVPQYSYVDGDGTVPAESAKADGFAAMARVGVDADHRGLLSDKKVLQLIEEWLGLSEKSHCSNIARVVDECTSLNVI